jgi:hypothetical protein
VFTRGAAESRRPSRSFPFPSCNAGCVATMGAASAASLYMVSCGTAAAFSREQGYGDAVAVAANLTNRRGCCSTDSIGGAYMATRTPPRNDKWNRPTYEAKDLSRLTSAAPAWAWGCELCSFGTVKGTLNQFCTCRAGQAKARWASGQMAPDDDEIHVPTFNGVRL